jgi:hypothetical protein
MEQIRLLLKITLFWYEFQRLGGPVQGPLEGVWVLAEENALCRQAPGFRQ